METLLSRIDAYAILMFGTQFIQLLMLIGIRNRLDKQ